MRNASRAVAAAVSLALPFLIFLVSAVLFLATGVPPTLEGADAGASAPVREEAPEQGADTPNTPSRDVTNAPQPATTEEVAPPTSAELARAKLDTVTTAHSAATGYLRAAFGAGWGDTDRNGCDARNDVLARDLSDVVFRPKTNDCVVHSGVLDDPYTGTIIHFLRGNETSQLVQIDHVVPLAWAWRYGAANWTHEERVIFHNDHGNLLAVDGASNMAKSDAGPGDWMPPNTAAHCGYAETFVNIVHAYALSIPDHDRRVLEVTLASC